MTEMSDYAIESYGGGFIVADYSGKRGRFGAAYRGKSGRWQDQPTVSDPFDSIEDAGEVVDELNAEASP